MRCMQLQLPPLTSASEIAARMLATASETSTSTNAHDAADEEIESMEAIYPASERGSIGNATEFCRVGAHGNECVLSVSSGNRGVCLVLTMPVDYPSTSPSVTMADARCLLQGEQDELLQRVAAACVEEAGEPALFAIATAVQEYLSSSSFFESTESVESDDSSESEEATRTPSAATAA
jgi:hypothetical protein